MSEERMRIRGELKWEECGFDVLPEFEDQILPPINPELSSPTNYKELLLARQEMMDRPQGIVIDAYQQVTALELKYPEGSYDNQRRSLDGLRGEVTELGEELEKALKEHPLRTIGPEYQETSEYWIHKMLKLNRLRFPDLSAERKKHYIDEEGDVLWYSSRVAAEIGVNLSDCFVTFLRESPVGGPLRDMEARGKWDQVVEESNRALSFDIIQKMALDNESAYSLVKGRDGSVHVNIDSDPGQILTSIADSLEPDGVEDAWDEQWPYVHIPDLKVTLGKLVWFVAYTSETLLNTELGKVAQANLEKITNRSAEGTTFSRRFRDHENEFTLVASPHSRRMPMQRPIV